MKKTIALLVFLALWNVTGIFAQDSNKNENTVQNNPIKSMVDAKRYVFKAQSVSPRSGGVRQLSAGYTLTVLTDTVMVDLPFYGRAYQAPIGGSSEGIKFTSTHFDYTVKPKKNGWDIKIKPADVNHAPQVFLFISTSGNASVRIISTDRDSISFDGTVEAISAKK